MGKLDLVSLLGWVDFSEDYYARNSESFDDARSLDIQNVGENGYILYYSDISDGTTTLFSLEVEDGSFIKAEISGEIATEDEVIEYLSSSSEKWQKLFENSQFA
jgi:hypothetical protein